MSPDSVNQGLHALLVQTLLRPLQYNVSPFDNVPHGNVYGTLPHSTHLEPFAHFAKKVSGTNLMSIDETNAGTLAS